MNLFNVDNDIDYLLSTMGKIITINGEDATALVGIENTKFDYIKIITKSPIKRGDLIIYNDNYYLVNTEVDNKKYDCFYKCKARHCNNTVKFIINSLYLKAFYAFVDSKTFSIEQDKYFSLPTGTINITVQDNTSTNSIIVGDRFIKFNSPWKISGVDKTETGLIVLTATLDIKQDTDDLVNEIPAGYVKPVIAITNTNPSSLTIGTPMQINVTVTQGSNTLSDIPITYTSSNSSVATIDNNGLLTGISEGSVIITASLSEKQDINTSITVNAIYEVVHNYAIALTGGTSILVIKTGQSGTITATVTDNGTTLTDKTVTWNLTDGLSGNNTTTYATISNISADTLTVTIAVPSGTSGGEYVTVHCTLNIDNTIATTKYVQTNAGF